MTYLGMSSETGRKLSDAEHIKQSIKDIILTPIGSRLERRDYGSLLFFLIDHPNQRAAQLKIMSATVMALTQWEPRIRIDSMKFHINKEILTLELTYYLAVQPNQKVTTEIEVR
ncbi:GPW/gp25 family protein [Utexia brackfieldae]|uniref:GPW/gp25 family protein n=1 Tax=Utexia brackfieldae TaxID=3074108 RepID=UPI00370D2D47